jgi:hypothetical protein
MRTILSILVIGLLVLIRREHKIMLITKEKLMKVLDIAKDLKESNSDLKNENEQLKTDSEVLNDAEVSAAIDEIIADSENPVEPPAEPPVDEPVVP